MQRSGSNGFLFLRSSHVQSAVTNTITHFIINVSRFQLFILQSRDGDFEGRWQAAFVYSLLRIICLVVGISISIMVHEHPHHILDVLKEGLTMCR